MRLSGTLSFYIARQVLLWIALVAGVLLAVVFLFDTVELLRRAASRSDVGVGLVFAMALLKAPTMLQEIISFAVLFGAMAAFARLSRHHELVIVRASGVSAWQFMLPAMAVAVALGAAKLGFVNPLAASMQARFEAVESRLLESGASALTLTGNGLWLRQAEAGGEAILHTPVPPGADMRLVNVTLFRYDATGRFIGRVDARSGALEDGQWRLVDAVVATPNEPARQVATYVLATELTSDRIMDSFSSPETISFWDLPGFIDTMQKAGLPALRHRLEWNRLASSPFMLAAMVLLAGAFSMRPSRQGGVLLLIGAGIAAGFVIYFGSDIVFALGLSQAVPVPLAAWAPALFTALLGGSLLIHMEDG